MTVVVRDPVDLQAELGSTPRGVVPTMGALHEGHLALIRRSAAENPATVVTIFVNPTQFSDPTDLAHYPRTLERDVALAVDAGATVIYAPPAETVYPSGFQTSVLPGRLAERWEGEHRPGHFAGVATVVAILLNTVRANRAYFGEKDFQQLCVVRRMHADLRLPGEIVGCSTVRATDGLALSSRNARLTADQRKAAAALPAALHRMAELARSGEEDAPFLAKSGEAILVHEPQIAIEYLAIVDPTTLDPVERIDRGSRALAAIRIGSVRLIDNVELLARRDSSA